MELVPHQLNWQVLDYTTFFKTKICDTGSSWPANKQWPNYPGQELSQYLWTYGPTMQPTHWWLFSSCYDTFEGSAGKCYYFNNWYLIEGDPTLYVKRGWLMIWAVWLSCDFKHPPVVIFWPTCVHLFFYEDKVKIGMWAGSIVDDNRGFKIPWQRQPWKCCLKSEFAFLQSLIAIIRIHLLCQMQESYSEAEFLPIISKFRKRKKILSSFVHVRSVKRETRHFHHRSHAKTEKKCTKKHAACAELLFCLFNLVAS